MKLRSSALLVLAVLGIAALAGFGTVKKKVKKKLAKEMCAVFDEKAKQFEKEMVKKYDIIDWEQEDTQFEDEMEEQVIAWEPVKEEELDKQEEQSEQQKAFRKEVIKEMTGHEKSKTSKKETAKEDPAIFIDKDVSVKRLKNNGMDFIPFVK